MIRPPLVLAALAALMGGAGVALAAAAEHESGGELGRTAALFLILHGAAALGVAAHARLSPSSALLVIGLVMEAGAALFAADLAMRAFTGRPFSLRRSDWRVGDDPELARAGGGVRDGGLEKRGRPQDRRWRRKRPFFMMGLA